MHPTSFPTDPDQSDMSENGWNMVGNGQNRSELVGILKVKKKTIFFCFLPYSERSVMSEKVGIGQNLWSEMSGALMGGTFIIFLFIMFQRKIFWPEAPPGGE